MGCPACEGKYKMYGFRLEVGGHYYTASEKACCPKKVVVTSFNHLAVKFTSEDGQEHTKSFDEFMKSSWRDKSC